MMIERRRRRLAWIATTVALLGASGVVRGQNSLMPPAVPGLIETGVPPFIVRAPGTLGLSSPPTDMHLLPDGRVLLVAAHELALGDGIRWQSFRRHPATESTELLAVAIDHDGTIYASVADGFARVDLGDDGRWQFTRVATFPEDAGLAGRVLSRVVMVRDEWYWHGGNGALVAWHPGRAAAVLGIMNDFDEPYLSDGQVFIGDSSTGAIYRITGDRLETFDPASTRNLDRAITCGVALADGRAMVGTQSLGVQLFDGRTLLPLTTRGPLASRARVNDLCATAAGHFCAALDNVGLVFFNADGVVVQVLDRTVDHRLSRIRRLAPAPGGEVWALLNDGVAIVSFPSRVSQLEPLVSTGLTYALPTRHHGRLWLMSDGLAQRGVYDESGRLLRFEIDSPGPWVSTILSSGERLLVGTAAGVFEREDGGWKLVVDNLPNAHLAPIAGELNRWLVVGQDEVAWLRAEGERITAERFPVPGMGSSFGSVVEGEGAFWAELGASRVARIVPQPDGRLVTRILGRADGWPDGWVQVFLIDGIVRFNVAGRVFRYDVAADRIVADREFLGHAPDLIGEHGRPARDAQGRLWISTNESVRVLDDRAGPEAGTVSLERLPPAFTPIVFAMEDSGVVWMHQRSRLMRFDPAMPESPSTPLGALITHVQLLGSGRTFFNLRGGLPVLDYADNSLVAHFLAPHAVFGAPVGFEVMLEGAGDFWLATGPTGSASFTQLKEGNYVLRVRPRSGAATGAEARLSFSIRAPWYRNALAYIAYVLAATGVIFAGGWTWSLLARRKRMQLEWLVAERTAELRQSEERYRRLSEELEARVQARTAELHDANERLLETNRELEAFSYSVSHDLRAPLRNISGFAGLLQKRAAGQIDEEGSRFLTIVGQESARLGHLIDSLLVFSRLNRAELNRRRIDLVPLLDEVRAELAADTANRAVHWHVEKLPLLDADATLLRQVFVNLLGNALKFTRHRDPAVITIGSQEPEGGGGEIVLFVRDNGVGFDPKYRDKLFGVFQRLHSVRDYEGSGIGLATVRRIVARHGGRVWAESAPGAGAVFFMAFPR